MPDRTIDILLNFQAGNSRQATNRVNELVTGLKQVEQQAYKTRASMEKIANIGNKMAFVGGAIIAPFALAMKKYLDTAKETEPTSKRLVELGKKWEESQVRIGRVTAEIVLPTLEKALVIVDKIAAFAEKNPDAIKAALGIGGTLVVLGGLLSTTATIVSTLATIQGLAAGFVGANAAGLAGVGAAGAGAGGAGMLAGLAPILLAVLTNPLTWAIAALVLIKPLMNYLLGTNQTWADIAATGHKALIIIGYYIDRLITSIGSFFANMGRNIYDGMVKLGAWIVNGIRGLIGLTPIKDSGGPIGKGLFRNMGGREFVMTNQTTKAAENVIGGNLTQQRLLQALAGGGGSKRVSYYDSRRFDASVSANDRRMIANDTINALAGAL